MTPLEAEDPDNHAKVRQVFFQKYRQIEEKRKCGDQEDRFGLYGPPVQ